MPALSPVDELAEIRTEIARLERRAAQLHDRLAKSALTDLTGRFHRAEVRQTRDRVFDPALLPAQVFNNPAYWRDHSVIVVHTVPVATQDAPLRPGWPIRRAVTGLAAAPAH